MYGRGREGVNGRGEKGCIEGRTACYQPRKEHRFSSLLQFQQPLLVTAANRVASHVRARGYHDRTCTTGTKYLSSPGSYPTASVTSTATLSDKLPAVFIVPQGTPPLPLAVRDRQRLKYSPWNFPASVACTEPGLQTTLRG